MYQVCFQACIKLLPKKSDSCKAWIQQDYQSDLNQTWNIVGCVSISSISKGQWSPSQKCTIIQQYKYAFFHAPALCTTKYFCSYGLAYNDIHKRPITIMASIMQTLTSLWTVRTYCACVVNPTLPGQDLLSMRSKSLHLPHALCIQNNGSEDSLSWAGIRTKRGDVVCDSFISLSVSLSVEAAMGHSLS